MDITLLVSFLAFAGMVASWVMLPTGGETAKKAEAPAAIPSTSKA
jgi:hypothetical protein